MFQYVWMTIRGDVEAITKERDVIITVIDVLVVSAAIIFFPKIWRLGLKCLPYRRRPRVLVNYKVVLPDILAQPLG